MLIFKSVSGFLKHYTQGKLFVKLWRKLSLTTVESTMILKLTIVDTKSHYVQLLQSLEILPLSVTFFTQKNIKVEEVI